VSLGFFCAVKRPLIDGLRGRKKHEGRRKKNGTSSGEVQRGPRFFTKKKKGRLHAAGTVVTKKNEKKRGVKGVEAPSRNSLTFHFLTPDAQREKKRSGLEPGPKGYAQRNFIDERNPVGGSAPRGIEFIEVAGGTLDHNRAASV